MLSKPELELAMLTYTTLSTRFVFRHIHDFRNVVMAPAQNNSISTDQCLRLHPAHICLQDKTFPEVLSPVERLRRGKRDKISGEDGGGQQTRADKAAIVIAMKYSPVVTILEVKGESVSSGEVVV